MLCYSMYLIETSTYRHKRFTFLRRKASKNTNIIIRPIGRDTYY